MLAAVVVVAILFPVLAEEPERRSPIEAGTTNMESRIEKIRWGTYRILCTPFERADELFQVEGVALERVPRSRFRLGVEVVVRDEEDGTTTDIKSDFHASVAMPYLEHRYNLFIESEDIANLPGTDPSEQGDDALRVGVERDRSLGHRINLDTRIGVKWRTPPVAFADAKLQKTIGSEDFYVVPRQKIFYETDDGFGEISSVLVDKWLGEKTFARSVSAGKWAEDTLGLEWEQSFILGHVSEPWRIGEQRVSKLGSSHRGVALRLSGFGHKSGEAIVDRYRISLGYRFPIYKRWIYGRIIPELEWRNEGDWEAVPGIKFGIEALLRNDT